MHLRYFRNTSRRYRQPNDFTNGDVGSQIAKLQLNKGLYEITLRSNLKINFGGAVP